MSNFKKYMEMTRGPLPYRGGANTTELVERVKQMMQENPGISDDELYNAISDDAYGLYKDPDHAETFMNDILNMAEKALKDESVDQFPSDQERDSPAGW
jgi:hypothetical protein